MLGTIKHLSWIEYIWCCFHFLGEPEGDLDETTSFAVLAGDTVESVMQQYRDACAESRRIVAAHPLDAQSSVAHPYFGIVSLRWIILHLVEEIARHAGHVDLLREATD